MPRPSALAALFALSLTATVGAGQSPANRLDLGTSAFESYLELLRQQAGIPGMSGALLQDGVVVWERGLGMANHEERIRATPDTPYYVADLSQTFAAVLLLQCVELRRLELDAPLTRYGLARPEGTASLRQVLSHSTAAEEGGDFRYDPARFALLSAVMENCVRQPYRRSMAHRLLDRLALIDTVPGADLVDRQAVPAEVFEPAALDRYAAVLQRLAVPYKVDRRRATRTDVPTDGLNAATGIVSTVRDLARLDAALDAGDLLLPETLAVAWAPVTGGNGAPLPTGLGWFTQTYRGTPIVWQFGVLPNAYSALVVKVPSHRATMILLANSDGLFVPSQLEGGDVTRSVFASVFLRMLL